MPLGEAHWSARAAPHHFDRTLRVLRDRERSEPDPKMIGFILQKGGADLEISGREFRILFAWNPSRHKYFLDLAPGVLSGLLDWCELDRVETPTLGRLRA